MRNRQNLNSEGGFTLIIVLISMVTLTFLSMEMASIVEWNSYKSFNIIDKSQAKLNAESGVKIALAKLRVYQEAFNLLEKNPEMKKAVSPSLAEKVATMPFAYPIPQPQGANIIQRQAIEKFEKESLLPQNGTILVSVQSVSGFINPNLLRVQKKKEKNENEDEEQNNGAPKEEKTSPDVLIEKKLVQMIERIIQDRAEDERFSAKFADLRPEILVKELKYYVNRPEDFKDVELGEIEPLYSSDNITPKHAPLSNVNELYLLQGWDDEIIELIIPRLSVNQVTIIQLNNITEGELKIIFPDITKDQIAEFFKHRDGDSEKEVEASPFKNSEDFKSAVVSKLAIVDGATYDKRIKELEDAGLKLGVAGKLFKVTSTGTVNQSTVTIEAIVDLPVLPKPEKPKKKPKKKTTTTKEDEKKKDEEDSSDPNASTTPEEDKNDSEKDKEDEKKKQIQLMPPRVVEMTIS